jgi:hypothetical protein
MNGHMLLLLAAVTFHLFVSLNRSTGSIHDGRTLSADILDQPQNEKKLQNIPIFYNLYAANKSELERVYELAVDQLSNLQSHHNPIYVHSIGEHLHIPTTTLLQHHTNASELVTLHSLWNYCQRHPNDKVIYLHSKGSFHPSGENDQMRKLLTTGALSDECANLPSTCNVCSYRFSPFPHPHTPGNMWLARCSYVRNLLEPSIFHSDMDAVEARLVFRPDVHGSCVGKGRFAAEHWVHSHPSVQPCDLYNNSAFFWGYDGLTEYKKEDFQLMTAPRYNVDDWPTGCEYSDMAHRIKEYRLLYNATPDQDWWGWRFWLGPPTKPYMPISARMKERLRARRFRSIPKTSVNLPKADVTEPERSRKGKQTADPLEPKRRRRKGKRRERKRQNHDPSSPLSFLDNETESIETNN